VTSKRNLLNSSVDVSVATTAEIEQKSAAHERRMFSQLIPGIYVESTAGSGLETITPSVACPRRRTEFHHCLPARRWHCRFWYGGGRPPTSTFRTTINHRKTRRSGPGWYLGPSSLPNGGGARPFNFHFRKPMNFNEAEGTGATIHRSDLRRAACGICSTPHRCRSWATNGRLSWVGGLCGLPPRGTRSSPFTYPDLLHFKGAIEKEVR